MEGKMLRSRTRNQRHHPMDPPEQTWPDETIVVLPETPRVRLSPRRKMNPQSPGWPPAYMGETIRMYHDPEDQEETVNFAMNPDFIENMHSFIPALSPTKIRMLSPSKVQTALEDDVIEIPDSAGLSDETREAIFNVWATDDLDEDSGFVEGMHYTRDCQATQYKQRNAKLNLTIRYLVQQLQEKEKEIQKIPVLEKKLINLQTQLKSLALIPMTPMRTSSLKYTSQELATAARTPRSIHSKENIPSRSRSQSPRKPLQEIPSNNIQPADLVREDTEEFIEHSKRLFQSIHTENSTLKSRVSTLEIANAELRDSRKLDSLQSQLEALVKENHRLEQELQISRAETSNALQRPGRDEEIRRLSEELSWHAKLHLFAEKERLRLLDLLEFAGREGQCVVKEYVGLKQKMSMLSLRSAESDWKCLV